MFEAHSLLDFWLHPQLLYSSFTSSLIDTTNRDVLDYSFHWKVVFGFAGNQIFVCLTVNLWLNWGFCYNNKKGIPHCICIWNWFIVKEKGKCVKDSILSATKTGSYAIKLNIVLILLFCRWKVVVKFFIASKYWGNRWPTNGKESKDVLFFRTCRKT